MLSSLRTARFVVVLLAVLAILSQAAVALPDKPPAKPETVPLATDGKAQQPVVIAKDASERTRRAAKTLAAYLDKISGAKFEVQQGDGASGIVVGTAKDF